MHAYIQLFYYLKKNSIIGKGKGKGKPMFLFRSCLISFFFFLLIQKNKKLIYVHLY